MSLLGTIIPVLLTALLGSWIAYGYQDRAAKENRFFNASHSMYADMIKAADKITSLVGKRIYASQKLAMVHPSSGIFEATLEQFRQINLEWNQSLLEMEMSVRALFTHSYLFDFEGLQVRNAEIARHISKNCNKFDKNAQNDALRKLQKLRSDYFLFIRGLYREASILHRQMHFGISVRYKFQNLNKFSNFTLLKLLFASSMEAKSIIRSPTDFGMPVRAGEARLGIHE